MFMLCWSFSMSGIDRRKGVLIPRDRYHSVLSRYTVLNQFQPIKQTRHQEITTVTLVTNVGGVQEQNEIEQKRKGKNEVNPSGYPSWRPRKARGEDKSLIYTCTCTPPLPYLHIYLHTP